MAELPAYIWFGVDMMSPSKIDFARSVILAVAFACLPNPAFLAQRSVATNPETAKTTTQIAAAAGPAVVTITAFDSKGGKISQGSGFLVRADGVVVTNRATRLRPTGFIRTGRAPLRTRPAWPCGSNPIC